MRSRLTSVVARYGLALFILAAIIAVQSLLNAFSIKISFTVPIIVGLVATAWYAGLGPGFVLAFLIATITAVSERANLDETSIQWVTRHASNFGLMVFIALVIAERRQVTGQLTASEERARAEQEAQFSRFFELGNVGMAIVSPDRKFVELNREICNLLGYSRVELQALEWTEVTHPDDRSLDPEHFLSIVRG